MACSCFFHVCAGVLLFFFHTEYRSNMALNIHATAQEATVRFFSFRRKNIQPAVSPAPNVLKKVKTQVTKKIVQKQEVKKEKVIEKKIIKNQQQKKIVKKEPEKKKNVIPKPIPKKEQVGHREFNMLQLQEKIQEAVEGVWSAPPGCLQATECTMKITIGWDGKVLQAEVQKSSGVLLYDITVEHAIPKIDFPHGAWGKTLTLAFKP